MTGRAREGSSAMSASFRAETLKTRKRWANWILVGILLAWILLLTYLVLFLVVTLSPHSIQGPVPASVLKRRLFPENFVPTVLGAAGTIGAAIMLIFGALTTASEFGWLTVQTILIQKPTRAAVLLGKFLTGAAATLLISIVVCGAAALASFAAVRLDRSSSSCPACEVVLTVFVALLLPPAVWT